VGIKLKKIDLPLLPKGNIQRKDCRNSRIKKNKSYLIKIRGCWRAGKFSEQWYGWNFDNWGCSGIQLDSVEGPLYEIIEE